MKSLRGALLAAVLLSAAAGRARADAVRVIASDATGVTLQVDVPAFVPAAGDPGKVQAIAPGELDVTGIPGRPLLPFAATLVALPPGARATVTVEGADAEQVVEGVRLPIATRTVFREDPGLGDLQPEREAAPAILDGVWPAAPAIASEPFSLRRQRVVSVQLHPYRYDAAGGRLYVRRSLRVRVSFAGGGRGALSAGAAGAEDRHWDPVMSQAIVNAAEARAWRESAPRSDAPARLGRAIAGAARGVNAAFAEDEPEVRVRLDSTTVAALDFDALAANGYPVGVPVGEVSVHRHEFIEGALVPYVTIELPAEVDDLNLNGVFDSGDRIVVWCRNWAQRSGASYAQRVWGDAEVVYATRIRSGTGLRVATRPGTRGATGLTPLASYPFTQHFEKNYSYQFAWTLVADTSRDDHHWVEPILYYARPESVLFETNDIDTTHQASLTLSFMGRAPSSHWIWAQVRNGSAAYTSLVDSLTWSERTPATVNKLVFGSALSEGRTNRLRMWGKTLDAPPDAISNSNAQAALNWFEATYWRAYRALGGRLECNNAGASGTYEIVANDFTDAQALRAYDVTDPLNPVRLTGVAVEASGGGWRLRMQDSTGVGEVRRYLVFDQPLVLPPEAYSAVTRENLSSNLSGDYLMIGPRAFIDAAEPVAQLRRDQGMSVVKASVDAVFDEFNGGRRSPYALRRFFKYAYDNWNARFVLLVGDGSMDPQLFDFRSSKDWVPTGRIMGPVRAVAQTGSFFELIPSDGWLVWCLDCTDPSYAPKLPDLYIGRLPVNSAAEAASVAAKIVSYENVTPDQAWRKDLLLSADDDFSSVSTFGVSPGTSTYCKKYYEDVFRQLTETVQNVVLNEAGLAQTNAEIFNLSYYLPNSPADVTPCPQVPDTCRCSLSSIQSRARLTALPDLMSKLNAGRMWWNYQGHANEYVLSHEEFYRSNGVQRGNDYTLVQNAGRPFLLTAFSCHPNSFAHDGEYGNRRNGGALGEVLVNLPNGRGAIASWASTGYEVLPGGGTSHINVTLARALFSQPPRDPYLGDHGARVVLGESIALALARNWTLTQFNSYESDVGVSYTLLGDPATRLSIGIPQAQVTANTQPVTSGQTVRLRTGRDTLDVEADLVSSVRLDSITVTRVGPGAEVAPIPPSGYTLAPAFPDTTNASGGGRRYHLSLTDTLRADSYRYDLRTVDRDGLANPFAIVLAFQTALFADGTPVNDLDVISPNATLSLLVLSPKPLDPQADLALLVGPAQTAFTATPANGDTTGREWTLTWAHGPYPFGETSVELSAAGGATRIHRFVVNVTGAELRVVNPLVFPNPFEDDFGTRFSFTLESASPVDVLIRVYTVSGRLVYERKEMGLAPSYHQLAWDGRDAEGSTLANGIYFYRLVAKNASASTNLEGRLVKLRKPRRVEDTSAITP